MAATGGGRGAAGCRREDGTRQLEVCCQGDDCCCAHCVFAVRFETVGERRHKGRWGDDFVDAVMQPACHERDALDQRYGALLLHREEGGFQGEGKPAWGAVVGVVDGLLGQLSE